MAEKEVDGTRTGSGASSRRPSEPESEEIEENSILSERTDRSFQLDDGDQSYVDHSEFDADGTSHISSIAPGGEEGDESSSQHEGTDEDVFTDKSPRSSLARTTPAPSLGKVSTLTT